MICKEKYMRLRKSLLNKFSEKANRLTDESPFNDIDVVFKVNPEFDRDGLEKSQ